MSCSEVKQLATPPNISANIQYLVGVTPEGETVAMERPLDAGVVVFTGDKFGIHDGSQLKPFQLQNLQIATPDEYYNAVAFVDSNGVFFKASNPTATAMVLVSINGGLRFEALPSNALPDTGSGFLARLLDETVVWMGSGLMYVGQDAEPTSIPDGDPGDILVIRNVAGVPVPRFEPPASGNMAQGSGVAGLEGMLAESIGQEQVNIKIPSMELTDGTNTVSVANVNVTVDITAALGLLGLDVGAENANTWYYIYVTSDGVGAISAIISTDPDAPDLTATTHTYWGFASVVRNDGAGNFVEYTQRGRNFQTVRQNLVSHGTVTTVLTNVTPTNPWNTIVPPIVKAVTGIVGGDGTAPAATIARSMIIASTTTGIGLQFVGSRENTGVIEDFKFDAGNFYDVHIDDPTSPTIAWRANQNDNRRRIDIVGYKI